MKIVLFGGTGSVGQTLQRHLAPIKDFMPHFRKALGVPIGLPATSWMIEIAYKLMGTDTELLLKSRRVIPTRLLDAGFDFRFVDWQEACRDLVDRSQKARA